MEYITIPQLARMLGLSRVSVYRKVKKGQIPARKIGHAYVITDSDLERILHRKLTRKDELQINKAVKKVVKQYGETLRLLGQE